MFPCMMLIAAVLNLQLIQPLLLPALLMAMLVYAPGLYYWWSARKTKYDAKATLTNPLEIKTVIGGRDVGLRVGMPLLVCAVTGLLVAWLLIW
jgi:hypothetical protein